MIRGNLAAAAVVLASLASMTASNDEVDLKEILNSFDDCEKLPTIRASKLKIESAEESQLNTASELKLAMDAYENCLIGRTLVRNKAWPYMKIARLALGLKEFKEESELKNNLKEAAQLRWYRAVQKSKWLAKESIALRRIFIAVADEASPPPTKSEPKEATQKNTAKPSLTEVIADVKKLRQEHHIQTAASLRRETVKDLAALGKGVLPASGGDGLSMIKQVYRGNWFPMPHVVSKEMIDSEKQTEDKETLKLVAANSALVETHMFRSFHECTGAEISYFFTYKWTPELIHAYQLLPAQRLFCKKAGAQSEAIEPAFGPSLNGDEEAAEVLLQCLIRRTIKRVMKLDEFKGKPATFEMVRGYWFLEALHYILCGDPKALRYLSNEVSTISLAGLKDLFSFLERRMRPPQSDAHYE